MVPGVGRLPPWTEPLKKAERLLFLNWRRDMDDMIEELDRQVGPDSELWLMSGKPETEQLEALREGGLDIEKLQNLHLVFRSGNTANRKHLEELRLERFDSVMILAEENTEDGSMQVCFVPCVAKFCNSLMTPPPSGKRQQVAGIAAAGARHSERAAQGQRHGGQHQDSCVGGAGDAHARAGDFAEQE